MSSAIPLPRAGEAGFLVEIERFQGPLDLLLHLIRQQDIDVFDIPISKITDQFLAAIQGIRAHDLDSAGEFLEMAATLVRIKAQMLLPRPAEEEDEDPRAELVRRLLEYEQIREITQRLERAELEWSRRRGKGYLQERPRPSVEEVPLETTWDQVFEAAMGIRVPERVDPSHRVTPRTVSVDEKTTLILESLRPGEGLSFRSLLAPFHDRIHGVMTFLAGLELGRRRQVHLRQAGPFRDLWLYGRDEEDQGGEGDPPEAVAAPGGARDGGGGEAEREEDR